MKHKLRIFVIGTVGSIILLTFIGLQLVASINGVVANTERSTHTYQVLVQLTQLVSTFTDTEASQRGYLLSGLDTYLTRYNALLDQIEQNTQHLRDLTSDNPLQQQRLDSLAPLIKERLALLQQTIDVRKSQGLEAAAQVVLTNQDQQLIEQIRSLVTNMQNTENVLLDQRNQDVDNAIRSSLITSLSTLLVIIVAFSFALFSLFGELKGHQRVENELRETQNSLEIRIRERTADLEKASKRAIFVADAGRILSSSLDYQSNLQQLAAQIVPQFADWCLIEIDGEGDENPYIAAAHTDAESIERVRELGREYLINRQTGISPVGFGLDSRTTLFTPAWSDRINIFTPDAQQLETLQTLNIRSAIAIPLIIRKKTIGSVVFVHSVSARRFEAADLLLAEELADRAGLAISNARLYQESQNARRIAEQNAARISRYQRVISALSQTLSVEAALEIIVEQGVSAFGAAAGTIAMLTENPTEMEIVGSTGYSDDLIQQWRRFSMDTPGIITTVMSTKQPVWLESRVAAEKEYPALVASDLVRQSWAGLPLFIQGRIVGAMSLAFANPQAFTLDDKAFITSLGQKCAQAIERSRLHDNLLEERERLQVTLSSIGDAVIATDAKSTITFINIVAQTLTGWSENEAIGMHLSDVFQIINESSRETVENPFYKVIRENRVVGLANHTLLITKNGDEIPIDDSGAPIRDKQGNISGVVLVFRDITERRHREIELESLLQRYQDLYETCHQIGLYSSPEEILRAQISSRYLKHATQATIIRFDRDWYAPATSFDVAAVLNPEVPVIGLSEDHIIADSDLLHLFTPSEPTYINNVNSDQRINSHLREMCLQSNVQSLILYPLEMRGTCFGVIVIYFDKPNPWVDQDYHHIQTFVAQVCVSLDNIHLLDEEKLARKEAEQANLIKLKFLAMISHELRTPLTSIKGFATTLMAKDVIWDTESQEEFISIINQEANKLTDLIEQLLDVSRLQAGTLRINLESRNIEEIINIARPQLEFLTPHHHLHLGSTENLPPVKADAQRMAQVLVNLVGNAAKYSPPDTEIDVTFAHNRQNIQVSVSDQGPGIPPDNHEQVFEAFLQLTSGSQEKGIGLGLAICKGLVEAQGGKIWIENRSTPGTTISFTLPIANSSRA